MTMGAATDMDGVPARLFSKVEKAAVVERLQRCLEEDRAVAFAYLHGSFLDELPCHDIDVGIHLQPGLDRLAMHDHVLEFAERAARIVGFPVDARLLNGAPIPFLFKVFRGRLLCSRNEGLRTGLVEETVARYLDMKPLLVWAAREAFGHARS